MMETVAVMMVMKKPSKSPSLEWRSGSAAPENEERDGGGTLDLIKFRPPENRVVSNI
jgi:hypothetical protein